jgi:hypothetical protein
MPRRARIAPGKIIYHALNRANGRSQLYDKPEDYAAFERVMVAALRRCVNRGTPYGTDTWKTKIAATLGLKYTLQPRGRPRKMVGLVDTQS